MPHLKNYIHTSVNSLIGGHGFPRYPQAPSHTCRHHSSSTPSCNAHQTHHLLCIFSPLVGNFPTKNQWHPDGHRKIRKKQNSIPLFNIHRFHDSKSTKIPMAKYTLKYESRVQSKNCWFSRTHLLNIFVLEKNTSTPTNFGANSLTFGFLRKKMPIFQS